ncbi:MAG: aldo/keto reductase [Actinomycetota bacterium]|nr:aldo/keto reductase [Actinomycetota bacterium]
MRTRRLGAHGPEISAVGYGAWEAGGTSWGSPVPDEQTIDAIRAGVEAGITWVDTAEVYGDGRSEELVARAVGADVMVFTKVAPRGAGSGFDPASVRRACEGSLRRLGRDVVDLYQLHWRDDSIPVEETWGAMAALVDDGLVRWIGVSNFERGLIERCLAIRHVDSLQQQFSMLHRDGEDDLFPWCAEQGIGVLAFGPLAYGLLTGAITRDSVFDDADWRSGKGESSSFYDELFAQGKLEPNLAIAERLRKVADRAGMSTAQLALAWILSRDCVTAAIAGSRSARHTVENAGAAALTLDPSTLEEIETILAGG